MDKNEYTTNMSGEIGIKDRHIYVEEGTVRFSSPKAYEKFLQTVGQSSLEEYLMESGLAEASVISLDEGEFMMANIPLDYDEPEEIKDICKTLMPFCKELELRIAKEQEYEWKKCRYILRVDGGKKRIDYDDRHDGFWDYEDIEDAIPDRIIGHQYLKRGLYEYKQYQSLDAYDDYFSDDKEFARDYVRIHHYGEELD